MASSLLYGKPQPRHTAKIEQQAQARQARSLEEELEEMIAAAFEFCQTTGQSQFQLAQSIPLHAPASPTDKRYQGFIMIGFSQQANGVVFTPVCKYGPGNSPTAQSTVEKKGVGTDLDKALRAVNKKLETKMAGKGRSQYVPLNQGQSAWAEITREDVAKGLAELLDRD